MGLDGNPPAHLSLLGIFHHIILFSFESVAYFFGSSGKAYWVIAPGVTCPGKYIIDLADCKRAVREILPDNRADNMYCRWTFYFNFFISQVWWTFLFLFFFWSGLVGLSVVTLTT